MCAGDESELPGRWRRRTAPMWVYHPPHAQAVPQRHSQPSPRGGLTGGGKEDLFSPPGWQPPPARSSPISSVPATGPATPAVQPSMAVLTTADPPTSKLEPPPPSLFPLQTPQETTRVESKAVFLSPQGSPGPLNPHPAPPRRPPRWLTPPPTICR